MVRRAGADMGIRTRRGFDWTGRYPWIVESALGLKVSSLVMDGEGVIVGDDGVSIVDKLHSRGYDNDVLLIGFDLLEMNGTDLRQEPLLKRKAALAKLLRRSSDVASSCRTSQCSASTPSATRTTSAAIQFLGLPVPENRPWTIT
jgi:bifunctional non-homologous end joining protein LigD